MAIKKQPFYRRLQIQSGGEASNQLADDTPPNGIRYYYQHISAINDLNAYTSVVMAAGVQGGEQEFNFVGNPQAGERVDHDIPIIVVEQNEHLVVTFTGATSGDTLTVYLRGYSEARDV